MGSKKEPLNKLIMPPKHHRIAQTSIENHQHLLNTIAKTQETLQEMNEDILRITVINKDKPKTTYTPSKGNVRIVGGKLFHVGDDVEGPISIQFIPDQPDPGPRGYSVAQSTSKPVGKPRYATDASGHRFHYIA